MLPKDFELEKSTVWSFKSRGSWATHNGNYRGNWSPYIPRNIILRYSNEGDVVLDYFCGAGTTAIECKLLNRNFKGFDINSHAIELTKRNLEFGYDASLFNPCITADVGDARYLNIESGSIDLICAHPPYSNIISYTADNPDDLSGLDINSFLEEMNKVAIESFRVLKEGKHCVILIGDMRKNKNVVPLGFWVAEKFTSNGFEIEEIIIKRQHNCKTTGFWYKNSIKYNFLLLAHEYLLVFKKQEKISDDKPESGKELACAHKTKTIKKLISKDIALEAKTVWVFPDKSWFKNSLSNLAIRYSEDNLLFINDFSFNPKKEKKYNLIILSGKKSLENNLDSILNCLNPDGILAVFCEDKRLGTGHICSPAMETEKLLRDHKSLKIKEIIVVAHNGIDTEPITNNGQEKYLDINHKYIIIYKKT
ncbi:MAG: hypothetical protein FJW68_08980 [Actinobacteria bacterium]|nr:hypothetical protein [Actinomycetota bacterium]